MNSFYATIVFLFFCVVNGGSRAAIIKSAPGRSGRPVKIQPDKKVIPDSHFSMIIGRGGIPALQGKSWK